MQVKVRKKKTSVTGATLFKGTQLEVSEEVYNMYKDEFELINDPKVKKVINEPKPIYKKKKEYKEELNDKE